MVGKKRLVIKPLTKTEFEALIVKAAQPLPVLKPDKEAKKTSESENYDDCNENHTH